MKNCTVAELIEILKKLDQNAIVCAFELDGEDSVFSSFEICRQFENVDYIDNHGNIINGNVVAIY